MSIPSGAMFVLRLSAAPYLRPAFSRTFAGTRFAPLFPATLLRLSSDHPDLIYLLSPMRVAPPPCCLRRAFDNLSRCDALSVFAWTYIFLLPRAMGYLPYETSRSNKCISDTNWR